jgi:hypothetical protein
MIRPGEYLPPLPQSIGMASSLIEEEEEHEAAPGLPPFEPLVLWMHDQDPSIKVEVISRFTHPHKSLLTFLAPTYIFLSTTQVIPHLACRLRPHQREGVQFLFECVMGLRGFEGQVKKKETVDSTSIKLANDI